jgi:hypothetical protein
MPIYSKLKSKLNGAHENIDVDPAIPQQGFSGVRDFLP